MIGEALEIDAELESVLGVRPGDVVEGLDDLAALHAGISCAGGHEAVDEHLRSLRVFRAGLRHGEAGLREQRVGGVALRFRGVLLVEAGAELVEELRREDVVMREGEAFVDLRRVVAALQRAACFSAIREGAGARGCGDDLAVFVGEAREERLFVGDGLVDADVALIGRDGRGEIDLVVVGEGVSRAGVGRGHEIGEQVGGDRANGHVGWIKLRAVCTVDRVVAVRALIDGIGLAVGLIEVAADVAGAHGGGGNAEEHGSFARQAQALIADEEEGGISAREYAPEAQRAAEGSPKSFMMIFGLESAKVSLELKTVFS